MNITTIIFKIIHSNIIRHNVTAFSNYTIDNYAKFCGRLQYIDEIYDSSYLIENKFYLQDELVEKNVRLYDILDHSKVYTLREEKQISITKKLLHDELKQPIIKYLLDNNINRACWKINESPININNSFIEYVQLNHSTLEIIGYAEHQEQCDGMNCDLVKYKCDYAGSSGCVCDRYDKHMFTFITNNSHIEVLLDLPVICNKNTILKHFLKIIKSFQETILIDEYRNLKTFDFDLYCIEYDIQSPNITVDGQKIDDSSFVVSFFRKNEKEIIVNTCYTQIDYVIVCKTPTSIQFQKYIQLPNILSDIVYAYICDSFESIIPNSDYIHTI